MMDNISRVTPMILAGGLGTRLQPVISDRPNVMATVSGKVFLTYLLDQLDNAGFDKVVLCCGHMSEYIEQCIGYNYRSLSIVYSLEDEPLGTAGAVRHAREMIEGQAAMIINGDSFIDYNPHEFIDWFFSDARSAAMLVTRVEDAFGHDAVEVNFDGRILDYYPGLRFSQPGLINAGVYLIDRDIIECIEPGQKCSLEEDVFGELTGDRLWGFSCEDTFVDIGTPESYAAAEIFFSTYQSGSMKLEVALKH